MIPSKLFVIQNYIKYQVMNDLTISTFKGTSMEREDMVNVYIDLGSMLDKMYNPYITLDSDPTALAAAILNLAGHMRSYFIRHHNIYSNIFFCYSKNNGAYQRLLYPEWNSGYIARREANKQLTAYIDNSLKLVGSVCKYLPAVYFVSREAEASGVIYSTIQNERRTGNNHPNIILTKEMNTFQIPAIDDRSFIYYKNAKFNCNVAHAVGKKDVIPYYLRFTNRYNPIILEPGVDVLVLAFKDISRAKFITKATPCKEDDLVKSTDGSWLPLLITLTNLPSRQIKSMLNWSRALKFINTLNLGDTDARYIYDRLIPFTKGSVGMTFDDFQRRFNALSIMHQSMIYDESVESSVDYRIDINNPGELQYINDHYFKGNFIELNKF